MSKELHEIYHYTFNLIKGEVVGLNSQKCLGCVESDCGTYYHNRTINAFYHELMGVPHYCGATLYKYELYSFKRLTAKGVQSTVNQKFETLFDYRANILKREYANKVSELEKIKEGVFNEIKLANNW